MAALIQIVIFGFVASILLVSATTVKAYEKKQPSCNEFSHGVTFNDSQAIGTWYLLHYKIEKMNDSAESHCVLFTPVTNEERHSLKDRIGQFVENLIWENLTLKMQIPCPGLKSYKTRDYYLERLGADGSYRSLPMPPSTAKLDIADIHRHPMRLKIIENHYLGMMDCHEKFVFLLGKQRHESQILDEKVKKMIDTYWPAEER